MNDSANTIPTASWLNSIETGIVKAASIKQNFIKFNTSKNILLNLSSIVASNILGKFGKLIT
jgi:hypothetical protein